MVKKGAYGDAEVLAEAKKRFERFKQGDKKAIPASMKTTLFTWVHPVSLSSSSSTPLSH